MKPWGLEVEDKGHEVIVRAELPGFEASELDVQLAGNLLTVRVRHAEEAGAKAPAAVEPRSGWLERTLTLPEDIEPDLVKARHRDGVLEVHVPRNPEARPRRMEANA
jgi:HSP20 family protein